MVTYLLDTAPFLWAVSAPQSLSGKVRKLIEGGKTPIVVSAVSLWEVTIKAQSGKLPVPHPARKWLEAGIESIDATVAPVRPAHVYALERLPPIHKDPFDRLLVAQAMAEGWILITSDETIRKYPAPTIW